MTRPKAKNEPQSCGDTGHQGHTSVSCHRQMFVPLAPKEELQSLLLLAAVCNVKHGDGTPREHVRRNVQCRDGGRNRKNWVAIGPAPTGSPGPKTLEESEKSLERAPRNGTPKVPRVQKSGFRLFLDSFETSGRTLSGLLGSRSGLLFPDSSRTLPWFWARRARESLWGAGPIENFGPDYVVTCGAVRNRYEYYELRARRSSDKASKQVLLLQDSAKHMSGASSIHHLVRRAKISATPRHAAGQPGLPNATSCDAKHACFPRVR